MDHLTFNINKVVKYILVFAFALAVMYLARNILIPIVFAGFFAALLFPVCRFLERKLPRILSIVLTFLGVAIILASISFFFGSQFYNLFQNIKDFGATIHSSIEKLSDLIDNSFLGQDFAVKDVLNQSDALIGSGEIIGNTLSISAGFVASVGLILVYTFLFLLYRSSFRKFIMYHFPPEKKDFARELILEIQKVSQNYFFGLIIIVLIMGSLNGVGLWIIGLDYPFLFGYFAALLAIIPYIGTFVGGLIPTVYALLNYDNIWTAIFVVLWYVVVQAIEGNILTPKIVGSRVSLNPLVAIIALLTGGLIWGVAGLILFVPFLAVIKVVFDHIEPMKPYGLLLSSNFGKDELPLLQRARKRIVKNVKEDEKKREKSNGAKKEETQEQHKEVTVGEDHAR